ncbi:uncharacterized protein LOC134781500 [Penaeus indicus]|uniref:uncharacterized protein LOC134781500 n=1 Tax=Penaeus indicus TaxID=29960 RepID=UPI00300C2BF7
MATKIKWLWKKTAIESFYEPFGTCYELTLVTRKPLLEEQFRCALSHFYRKVPNVRACFAERDGEMWLREMPQEKVDFELLPEDRSDEDIHSRLQNYDFNKQTGPLWCVKLRPEPDSSPDGVFREGVQGYPHMYSMYLGINHAITDGTSNSTMCGFIVQLLDDVLAGKEINDEEQLGTYIPDEKTQRALREQEALVNGDPELQSKLTREYQGLLERHSLVKTLFKGVGEEKARTLYVTRDLDEKDSAALFKRCRAEGITVNSAFTAIGNFAMVDLLAKGGLEQDTYSIRCDHVVNGRRYWKSDPSTYLGCHILPLLPTVFETPRNFNADFWNYAKSINEETQRKLKSATVLQMERIKTLVPKPPDFDPTFEFEYCITNMGDLTKNVTEGGDHVQVVNVNRTASLDKVPFIWANFLHSFRGRFINTLAYNTLYVDTEIVEFFFEKSFHYLHASLKL